MDKFTDITREQFEALNQRLALFANSDAERQQLENDLARHAFRSFDPMASGSRPPLRVNVDRLIELGNLVGKSDNNISDAFVKYPPPLAQTRLELFRMAPSKAEFVQTIDKEFADQLALAEDAYLKGEPEKVEEYVPLINAASFPRRITVFTAAHLDVPPGQTYTIEGDDPVSLNFEKVTIGQDARILIRTKAYINIENIDEADLEKFFFEGKG